MASGSAAEGDISGTCSRFGRLNYKREPTKPWLQSYERAGEWGLCLGWSRSGSARYILIATLAGLCGFAVLTISLSERSGAAFPGTNGKIAFSNGQSYVSQSIYSVNSDGSSPTGLTSGTDDYSPSYSADGSKVAFNRQNNVVVMNSDGSGAVQIATGTKSESASSKWQANYKDPFSAKIIPEVKIETRMRSGAGLLQPGLHARWDAARCFRIRLQQDPGRALRSRKRRRHRMPELRGRRFVLRLQL